MMPTQSDIHLHIGRQERTFFKFHCERASFYISGYGSFSDMEKMRMYIFQLTKENAGAKGRWKGIMRARRLFCFFCRHVFWVVPSYSTMGEYVHIDHATAIYHCRTVLSQLEILNQQTLDDIDILCKLMGYKFIVKRKQP